tara:strand:+ start:6107 stop:6763 length:657 start_codon:yes stop_codon:yes gene_type:complete
MGEMIELTAADGHKFAAYRAAPAAAPKGGIVLLQEIFGVNSHIREVCDGYAKDGYLVVAPALFDRVKPSVQLGYEQADIKEGLDYRAKVAEGDALKDIDAAAKSIRDVGSITVIGYCWGGTLTYLAACRLASVDKAVSYYGGQVAQYINEEPKIPIILHLGDADNSIPMSDVEMMQAKRPDIPMYVYAAGHGFNCDQRGSYDAAAAKLARDRTLDFIG